MYSVAILSIPLRLSNTAFLSIHPLILYLSFIDIIGCGSFSNKAPGRILSDRQHTYLTFWQ